MRVDTGAADFIILKQTQQEELSQLKLRKLQLILKTCTNEPMHIIGQQRSSLVQWANDVPHVGEL